MIAVLRFSAANALGETVHFSNDPVSLYQAASRIPAPSGVDVLIVENEERVSFDDDGKAVRTRYFLYRVLTQKGASEWANVTANWEPWHEERPVLRARVITSDYTVHELDLKTITDGPVGASADNVFEDRRLVRAPLPAMVPGSLVEEELVAKQNTLSFSSGSVERFYFSGSVPIQHTRLILDFPSTATIRYDIRLLPNLKPERTEAEGRVHILFESGPSDAVESVDPNLPSDIPAYPSVTFSTGIAWQRVAEEYSKIVDKQLVSSNLKSLVTQIVAQQKSRNQKLEAILQYLGREIRYTGVEFTDATIIPRSPSETLTRKFGDCKDKAALLVAMLRAVDVPAYVSLLAAGDREDVSPDLPGLGAFDHAIVYVPGSPDLWIDPTDEFARPGELPSGDQGRLALIARPETKLLVLTPVAASTDNALIEKRELFLAENGPARVVETSQPHGSLESAYRRAYREKDSRNAREELTNYIKNQYLAEGLDRIDRSDPVDLSRQFELVLESERVGRGRTELDSAVAAIRLEGLFSRLPVDLREKEEERSGKSPNQKPNQPRTSDYLLPQAFVTDWHYTITPPAGFQPKPLPENLELSLGPGKLTEQFAADKNGVVQATICFDTVKRRLTASESRELREKVVQLLDAEPILVYFEPLGQVLLNQGEIRGALKAYRDLIALHPNDAVHHLRLAKAFLVAGLGESARVEARTAVKLEPKSALAEQTLAEILEYDSVGRRFRPGSDYVGAEAAYRAAIALDPADKANVANLAVLLEYNRWGLRYGPGAHLKDALAEYRKLTPEELAAFGMQNNVPFDLYYDGQFAEARKAAEELNPQPLAVIVACEAVLNGSKTAITEARKHTGQEEEFKRTAAAAGDMLINMRLYPEGADLEEAGESGNTASDTAAYVSLYRKTVPHEQFKFSDDPAGVALQAEAVFSDPNMTRERLSFMLSSIGSHNGAKVLNTSELNENSAEAARGGLSQKARNGDFPDVGLDLALTRAQPKVQGNDTIGYKVTLFPNSNYKTARYIVKEAGRYKLLGTSQHVEGVALEVLDRVGAGNLADARILLDWIREDYHPAGGDDPLYADPFPRMWTKGEDADTFHTKIAAAAILTIYPTTAAIGVSILAEAVKSGDKETLNIKRALVAGYGRLNDTERQLAIVSDLANAYPESDWVFEMQQYCLSALGRFADAETLAQARLKRRPGDIEAIRSLVAISIEQGDYSKANDLLQKLIETGQAEPQDLNTSSWNSLFTGKTTPEDLENALKAAQLSNYDTANLHTLGSVYAELGKTKEAREVLIQSMDSLNLDEPDDNYWYAFGRIAEQYGEREAAISDYNRVAKPKTAAEIPSSTYRLAQIRLQALHNGS